MIYNSVITNHRKIGVIRAISKYKLYYLLILPGVLYYLVFHYLPMFGVVIAFKDIAPFEGLKGIINGEWVGFKHFSNFFNSVYFWQILRNTVLISTYRIIFGFPAPILLALLLNEIRNRTFMRTVQTISYLPHFISIVVVVGLTTNLLSTQGGLINEVIKSLGGEPIFFLGDVKYFRGVIVGTDIWKRLGWESIIYIAAMTSIDIQLYEAAVIDGANKLRKIWHITLPSISNIIVIVFIFAVGDLLNAGFEKILLLYSPPVYEVSDIIDTYVYREGLIGMKYSYSSAVNFFKSFVAMFLLLGTNYIAKKFDQEGIW